MPDARHTVTIDRRVEDVFSFVADGETAPRWRSGVLDIKRISGEGVGARYAQRVRGPMRRRVAADYEVTAFESNRRIEFQTTTGPVRPHGRFDFEPADGGTRLTFSLDAKVSGIQGRLMGGMVQKTMEAEVAALSKLKQVMEG